VLNLHPRKTGTFGSPTLPATKGRSPTPGSEGETFDGDREVREVYPNEIRVAGVNQPEPRKLARGGTNSNGSVAHLGTPQFSPDARRVYFWSEAAATGGEVLAIELATDTSRVITGGNEFRVIPDGT